MPQALTPNSPIPADEKRLSAYLFEDFFLSFYQINCGFKDIDADGVATKPHIFSFSSPNFLISFVSTSSNSFFGTIS